MEFHLLLVLSLLCVALAPSNACLPDEEHWKSVLPNTPLPKALEDLSQPCEMKRKGPFLDDGMAMISGATSSADKEFAEDVVPNDEMEIKDRSPDDGMAVIKGATTRRNRRYNRRYDKKATSSANPEFAEDVVNNDDDGMAVIKGATTRRNRRYNTRYNRRYDTKATSSANPEFAEDVVSNDEMKREGFSLDDSVAMIEGATYDSAYHTSLADKEIAVVVFNSSWSEDNADELSGTVLFYLYNDLYPGRKMTFVFNSAGSRASTFLSHDIAKSIPFSSEHVPKILDYFSIKTGSEEAELIKYTIEECEDGNMTGETKSCPTSLKTMIDFAVARLGRNIKVVSNQSGKKQEYTVLMGGKKISNKTVICHKEMYPYAVYYCHEIKGTEVFVVPFIGADGIKVKVVTVCHTDTSSWSPDHYSFQETKSKPGTPMCHFLADDALAWVQTKDSMAHLSKPSIDDLQVGVSQM